MPLLSLPIISGEIVGKSSTYINCDSIRQTVSSYLATAIAGYPIRADSYGKLVGKLKENRANYIRCRKPMQNSIASCWSSLLRVAATIRGQQSWQINSVSSASHRRGDAWVRLYQPGSEHIYFHAYPHQFECIDSPFCKCEGEKMPHVLMDCELHEATGLQH